MVLSTSSSVATSPPLDQPATMLSPELPRQARSSVSPASSPARRMASPASHHGSRVISRPTSPPRDQVRDGGPPSPARSTTSDVGLFERDVEFATEHLLSPHEAVDIGIPPVLSEAALALAEDDLPTVLARAASNASLAGAVSGGPSPSHSDTFGPLFLPPAYNQPGWQSPSLTYALERAERAGSPGSSSAALDSPPTGGWAGPLSNSAYSPATSPEPPLLEAKLAAACVSEPPLSASPLSSAPNSPRSISPQPMLTVMPFPTTMPTSSPVSNSLLGSPPTRSSTQNSANATDGARDRRRLSFLSYADLINIERGKPLNHDPTFETTQLAAALQDDSALAEFGERREDGQREEDTLTMRQSKRVPPALSLDRAN